MQCQCPHCGVQLISDVSQTDQEHTCPKCKGTFHPRILARLASEEPTDYLSTGCGILSWLVVFLVVFLLCRAAAIGELVLGLLFIPLASLAVLAGIGVLLSSILSELRRRD